MSHVASGEDLRLTVAERLRTVLEEQELSQRGLAKRLAGEDASSKRVENVRRQVAKWLSGQNVPTAVSARRLAAVLGTPPDYFMAPRGAAGAPLLQAAERLAEAAELLEESAGRQERLLGEQAEIAERLERLLGDLARREAAAPRP
jgi:transcriptional regulator with XRE-family HTH domain